MTLRAPLAPRLRSASRALALAVLVALPACSTDPTKGYSFSSTHDESIRTVAVPIFNNSTFEAGLDAQLTEAIIKEIQRTTRWTVVSSGAADATLSGSLLAADLGTLSRAPVTGLTQEHIVTLRVDFEFKDNRSGQVISARRGFAASETFIPARGVGERLGVGQHNAVQTLARDVVHELRSGW
ncbi:MAG: hypothetical protein JNL50_06115 [Phycisphaerae bacterium]|nr:hypothetical protein [Phycisphaerae bacterium]